MRMNHSQCQTEAENHSTEPLTKSENKTVLGPDGSMHEIRIDSIGREWIDIGGAKRWIRWCPSCGKAILCPSWRQAVKLTTRRVKCLACGYATRRNPPKRKHKTPTKEELTRKCPKCGCDIVYTDKGNRNNAEKLGRLCKMCLAKSKRKYETPDRLVRNCPQCGKEIEYTKGKDLSVRRHYWLRDVRENRLCNKCARSGKNNGAYGLHRFGKDNPNYGTRWTDEQRDKARKYWSMKFAERGYTFNNHNPVACEYFDRLSKERGWNLQHARNGGEHIVLGYFLDAYDKTRNIVVEYDESYHFICGKLRQEDVDRMTKIKQTIGCRFFRYDEPKNELREY